MALLKFLAAATVTGIIATQLRLVAHKRCYGMVVIVLAVRAVNMRLRCFGLGFGHSSSQ